MKRRRLALSRQFVALPLLLLATHMLLSPAASSTFLNRQLSSDVAEQPTAITVKEVYNGLDFVQGIVDANIRTMVLMTDVVFQDADWAGVPTPLLVDRSVTLAGDPSVLPNPRVLNMNWVAGKLRLGDGVVFRLQQLVAMNYRLGNHNQAPGLDIFVPCLRGASAVVETVDAVGVHRICYPPKVQEESLAQLRRPASVPGNQVYHIYVPQPDCVNNTSAPALERCWPHRGMYDDVAMPGAELYDFNQRVQLTGYSVHMIRTSYLCDLLLTDSCVQNLTALGCATVTYASLTPPWQPLARRTPPGAVAVAVAVAASEPTSQQSSQQQQQRQQLVSEQQQQDAALAADGSSSLSTGQKAGIAAGVTGGLVLVSLIAVVAFLVWRRRRRGTPPSGEGPPGSHSHRQQQQQQQHRQQWMGAESAASWSANPLTSLGVPRGEQDPAGTAIGIPTPFTTTSSSTTHSHADARRVPAAVFDEADADAIKKGAAAAGRKGNTAAGNDGGAAAAAAAVAATPAAGRRSPSSRWRQPSDSASHSAATTAVQDTSALGIGVAATPVTETAAAAAADASGNPAAAAAAVGGPARLSEQVRGGVGGGGGDSDGSGSGGGGGGGGGGGFGAEPLADSQQTVGHNSNIRTAGVYEMASASAGSEPVVVVTPLTPYRPDINLQLVLRNPNPPPTTSTTSATTTSTTTTTNNNNITDGEGTPEPGATIDAGSASTTTTTTTTSGSPATAPTTTTIGSVSGEEEVALIPGTLRGKGSFGRVVEGTFRGQRVAVKLIAGGVGLGPGPIGSEQLMRSFMYEVEVLARCTHPNVVRLLAACVTPPRLCLVMELMETSLEQLIERAPGRLLPMSAVLSIALDISQGLEYLHPTIVHRDLKPANVLVNDPLGPRQLAKLSDFGLARLHCSELRTKNPEAGTPAYMAPECFDVTVATITFHVDMYALGILLWVMLTGIQPWQGLNFMRLAFKVTYGQERPPLDAIPLGRRPPKLLRLIQACWEADPRRRPAAAEAVKELLLLQEMAARQQGTLQAPSQVGSESSALSGPDHQPHAPGQGLNSPQQQQQQQPQQPQQLRCMDVLGGLAADAAARAAAAAAAAAAYQQQHPQQAYEQQLYEQRLYEQVVLQRLAVGRVPRTALHRQYSFCDVSTQRWQRQLEAQLLVPDGVVWDPAADLADVPTLPQPRNRHQHPFVHPAPEQQQQQQRQGCNEGTGYLLPEGQGQMSSRQLTQQQQQQASVGRFVASMESNWRTALSLRFPGGERTRTASGSGWGGGGGGTALQLTIDGMNG